METAFLALVNYMSAGLLLAYNVQAFLCMYKKTGKRSRGTELAMKLEIGAIFTLCFLTLYLRSDDIK